jgi:hypothetical protein
MNRRASVFGTAVLVVCAFVFVAGAEVLAEARGASPEIVTVRPEESDELLANPGIGWETFHRTRDRDENLPDWIPSTVHYARWGWGTVEPRPGEIDHAFFEKVLAETRAAGQRLAFRVMCCSTSRGRPYHPDWLEGAGGRVLVVDYGNQEGLAVPDLDDAEVLERHLDLIRRLGARYDGHADIDHVDLGSVGWWGEWHMSNSKGGKMPTMENRKRIIDAYMAAFRKTPLLMLIGGRECLAYANQRGTGWRADCLGDMGGFSKNWCHMRDAYPELVQGWDAEDVWKRAPVAWETCWEMRRWVRDGWPLRYIFNYALALHGSYINNKSAPLPEGENVRYEIERFLRRLGYRLVLRELKHPRRVKAGEPLEIEMRWQNVGSAPCYKPYRVAYRLTGEGGYAKVLVGRVTVEKWMPGTVATFTEEFMREPPDLPLGDVVEVGDRVVLAEETRTGRFRLAVGIVGENSSDPAVRLAVKGRDADGWYPLSEIEITN